MIESRSWWSWGRERSLAGRIGILSLAILAACGVVAPIAGWLAWPTGLLAAVAAALLCWLGAVLAPVAECRARVSRADQVWMGFVAVFHFRDGPLARAGIVCYLVVFYLILLGIEAATSLPGGAQGLRSSCDRRDGTS